MCAKEFDIDVVAPADMFEQCKDVTSKDIISKAIYPIQPHQNTSGADQHTLGS